MSAPNISMIDSSSAGVGLGNYKGIMLCNRPFGGTAGKAPNKLANKGEKTTFSAGVVPETIGLNVPISAKEKLIKRPKKDSVLAKHKKWLSDLQKTKDRLEYEYVEEIRRKEESQAKFQQHEAQMREVSRTILKNKDADAKQSKQTVGDKGGVIDELQPSDSKSDAKADAKVASGPETSAAVNVPTAADAKSGKSVKPAWALSEKAAEDQKEEMELSEESDLLEFAKSLDFDKVIGDIEVQTMMEKLRKRITDLEKEVAVEEQRDADVEARAVLRAKLELMGKAEASLQLEADGAPISAESAAMNEARALLQDEEDMQHLHSTKSVAAMLQQAKDKIETVSRAVNPPPTPTHATKIKNEPIIVTHEVNEGARLGDKNDISNLPYMHRNPAV